MAELLFLNFESNSKGIYMYVNSVGNLGGGLETEAFAVLDTMNYIQPEVRLAWLLPLPLPLPLPLALPMVLTVNCTQLEVATRPQPQTPAHIPGAAPSLTLASPPPRAPPRWRPSAWAPPSARRPCCSPTAPRGSGPACPTPP